MIPNHELYDPEYIREYDEYLQAYEQSQIEAGEANDEDEAIEKSEANEKE